MVLGLITIRGLPGDGEFTEILFGEPDGKGPNRLAKLGAGQGDHGGGVDATAEKDRHRHVCPKVQPDRFVKHLIEFFKIVVRAAGGVGRP